MHSTARPAGTTNDVLNAAHGSSDAPTRPSSVPPDDNTAGAATDPRKPRNAERSAVHDNSASHVVAIAAKAVRCENSAREAFLARIAPVAASASVTTEDAVSCGRPPRTRCA